MRTSTAVGIVVVILVFLVGWYLVGRSSSTQPSPSSGIEGSNTQSTGLTPVVHVVHSTVFGDYLVATNGMTLYRYTKDTPEVSNCTGTCAEKWPPYSKPVAEVIPPDSKISAAVSATTRADKTQQVTYKGIPLYFWTGDKKPGDVTGQNVGGVWFVVTP